MTHAESSEEKRWNEIEVAVNRHLWLIHKYWDAIPKLVVNYMVMKQSIPGPPLNSECELKNQDTDVLCGRNSDRELKFGTSGKKGQKCYRPKDR